MTYDDADAQTVADLEKVQEAVDTGNLELVMCQSQPDERSKVCSGTVIKVDEGAAHQFQATLKIPPEIKGFDDNVDFFFLLCRLSSGRINAFGGYTRLKMHGVNIDIKVLYFQLPSIIHV